MSIASFFRQFEEAVELLAKFADEIHEHPELNLRVKRDSDRGVT
jgi:hypothetical protein